MIHRIYEMANYRPKETGLLMVIWLQPKTGKEKHGCRIKVERDYGDKSKNDTFTITIPDLKVIGDTGKIRQEDITDLKRFIQLNMDIIKLFWDDEISSTDFGLRIKHL